ncbi:LysM peptidoglycan-binding domain-containing protein [Modestobacter sp. VKM Ac-2979]|uniref:LysM peptidoglycan-binding domain-containing protein n=1 Tax=unclassified Modestobacter TaxID=2643866 RepID=UPI0022ABBC2B|nr:MULTISPECIES: LysM peptidoglycan-binding domain-containing protein [unclassified Modestobacter]MCZ2814199.1 LysM peptidoglycan-binding domain-containing protein [Modestobacter sp. VKM Ac-2979]MCZ2844385.1 LysM peptidoglycan-binding domain-containing protein [Modestobacter sp. VKM Ac-2980]
MPSSSRWVRRHPVGHRPATRRPAGVRRAAVLVLVGACGALVPATAQASGPGDPTAPVAAPPVVEQPAPYVGQTVCDPAAKPGTADLAALVLAAYAAGSNGGISRDCAAGGTSEHKEGRAWDWLVRADVPEERAAADRFLGWLTADGPGGESAYQARRLGVMYVIWDGRTWSADRASAGWLPYTGADPHTGHVHLSQSWSGALGQTSWWTGVASRVDHRTCAEVVDGLADPGALATVCAPIPMPEPAPSPVPEPGATYTVVAGDTLGQIALDHGTTVAELVAVNELSSTVIMVGQVLAVPGPPAPAPEPTPVPVPAPEPVTEATYTVVAGDTLGQIALDHGTTVAELVAVNGLSSTVIMVGQVLLLPPA